MKKIGLVGGTGPESTVICLSNNSVRLDEREGVKVREALFYKGFQLEWQRAYPFKMKSSQNRLFHVYSRGFTYCFEKMA